MTVACTSGWCETLFPDPGTVPESTLAGPPRVAVPAQLVPATAQGPDAICSARPAPDPPSATVCPRGTGSPGLTQHSSPAVWAAGRARSRRSLQTGAPPQPFLSRSSGDRAEANGSTSQADGTSVLSKHANFHPLGELVTESSDLGGKEAQGHGQPTNSSGVRLQSVITIVWTASTSAAAPPWVVTWITVPVAVPNLETKYLVRGSASAVRGAKRTRVARRPILRNCSPSRAREALRLKG